MKHFGQSTPASSTAAPALSTLATHPPLRLLLQPMSFEGHTADSLWGNTSTMTQWYDRQRRKEAREVGRRQQT